MSEQAKTQRAYTAARQKGDLVGVAEAILRLGRPSPRWMTAKALDALHPYLDDESRRLRSGFPAREAATERWCDPDRTPPVSLTANLDLDERTRIWQILIGEGERSLVDAVKHVDPPITLVPSVVDALFSTASRHRSPNLGPFSSVLAKHHTVDPVASANWYMDWMATRSVVVDNVAAAPEWIAVLHSQAEVARLARLLVDHPHGPVVGESGVKSRRFC